MKQNTEQGNRRNTIQKKTGERGRGQGAELLAPAGNMACFPAALKAGADAVYLGGKAFGARAYAENFSTEEIISALETAHLFGRRIYLTLNTLLRDDELAKVYDELAPLYEAGLDGVIVQDLGVVAFLRQNFPKLPIHASTQMSISDVEGIRYLQELGIKRVVPARELSLEELRRIREQTGMELECFIHGALCYSYSGRCLMSSFIGGRSGNRGRCAGPCRLPYNGQYLLSAKDICTIEILDRLLAAGIYSLKIEGRMKSPEYVAGVTGLYRRRLNRILAGEAQSKEALRELSRDRERLINLYTRSGNSQGYYFQKNGPEMISLTSPSYESAGEEEKHRLVSEVAGQELRLPFDAKAVFTEGERSLLTLSLRTQAQADCSERDPAHPSVLCKEISVQVYGEVCESAKTQALTEEEVRKQLERAGNTDFILSGFSCEIRGKVFLTKKALNELRREGLRRLREKILSGTRRELSDKNEGQGKCLLTDKRCFDGSIQSAACGMADGVSIKQEVYSEPTAESSSQSGWKRPLLHIRLNGLTGLSSALNYRETDIISMPYLITGGETPEKQSGSFEASFSSRIDLLKELSQRVRTAGKQFFLILPRIVRNGSLSGDTALKELLLKHTDGVVIDNPEELYYIRDIGYDKMILADIHQYAMNRMAALLLRSEVIAEESVEDGDESDEETEVIARSASHKVTSSEPVEYLNRADGHQLVTTVPVELNRRELLRRGSLGEELIVYGYLPMMLSSQCVKKTTAGCDHTREIIGLSDRYRNTFYCENLCGECTNVIYNCVPLFLEEKDLLAGENKEYRADVKKSSAKPGPKGFLRELSPVSLRLEFTRETEQEIDDIIQYYVNFLKRYADSLRAAEINHSFEVSSDGKAAGIEKYTKGHFNRGVE